MILNYFRFDEIQLFFQPVARNLLKIFIGKNVLINKQIQVSFHLIYEFFLSVWADKGVKHEE